MGRVRASCDLDRGQRRHWLLAAGTVAAVAVAAIALLALLPAGGGGPSNAAAALNRLASLVSTQSLTPQPGQYLYVAQEEGNGAYLDSPIGACEIRSREQRETWIGTDGSGLIRETSEPGHLTSEGPIAPCVGAWCSSTAPEWHVTCDSSSRGVRAATGTRHNASL